MDDRELTTPTPSMSPSPGSTPCPRSSETSSTSPPSTVSQPQVIVNVKQEEDDGSFLIQSVGTYDLGYESSVDDPVIEVGNIQFELEAEKRSYPGARTWAEEEERLFEILFQRADIPLLPAHWDVDFRGIPVVDTIFSTNDEMRPVIYSRSTRKEYQAAVAIVRLIDLTSSVRTTIQSGLRRKAPPLIKRSLDKYIAWAAEDGGYSHLRIVPNITTAVVDAELGEEDITKLMEKRMRALAMAQREFLRVDRDETFWDVSEVKNESRCADLPTLLVEKYMKRIEAANSAPSCQYTPRQRSASPADTTPTRKSSSRPLDSDVSSALEKERQNTPAQVEYRHKPPVVYGLFILRTSVFLLTVDSAKGDSAYVSFHVDMHFMDRHQSVWNALTAAIAVCLARDQLVERIGDFEELPNPAEDGGNVLLSAIGHR